MDLNPAVAVADKTAPSPKSSKHLSPVIWYTLITVAILVGIIYLYKTLSSKPVQQAEKAIVSQVTQIHEKRDLEKDLLGALKLNFSSSKYYENISVYMSQADKAKTTELAYQAYAKAFSFASKAYTESKKPELKATLLQFKDFLQVFPMYKEADAVIPK